MTLVLRYSARSDRGLVRQNNQDAVYAGPRLLAFADGMGGHAAGEVALVAGHLAPWRRWTTTTRATTCCASCTPPPSRATRRSTGTCWRTPTSRAWAPPSPRSCSTGTRLGLVHIGDSRAYRCRDGMLTQITQDDTFVQSLIDEGRITEEEAHTHPQRSLLLRAHQRAGRRARR